MNQKIETSLRRAVEQLPQPDLQMVVQAPVQRMEVHDYVTRQEMVIRPVRRRPMALAGLLAAALALCVGLTVYFQFFQIYSVVDLRVNPSFAIQLNRRDQVRGVQALNADAEPILEGRSYRGWTLEAVVSALVDELVSKGYLDEVGDTVDVAVNSKNADRGRELRIYVEELLDQRLTDLPATVVPEPLPEETAPPVQTAGPAQTEPPAQDPAAIPSPTPAVAQPVTGGLPRGENGLLTREAVESIVQAQTPGAWIGALELDDDDGRFIYEIKYWDSARVEYEMDIDASTGEVLKWERD